MQKKKGISLIVLVITIIVMIILAASVVITLSNTGIVNKANQAVNATNESQIQDMAVLVWTDAYMDGLRGQDLQKEVKDKLEAQGVKKEDWNITVTDTGVTVAKISTLGALIKGPEDYGKTVDYTVTVTGMTENNGTYNKWKIFYHNEDYVYLILADKLPTKVALNKGTEVTSLSDTTVSTLPAGSNTLLDLYNIFTLGQTSYALSDDYSHHKSIAQLIGQYQNYANTTDYGSNVVGAIGTPTFELFSAGLNSKKPETGLSIASGTIGYAMDWINGEDEKIYLPKDGLYLVDYSYVLASPSGEIGLDYFLLYADQDNLRLVYYANSEYIRPVVCLKASMPASIGAGDYNFNLVKE